MTHKQAQGKLIHAPVYCHCQQTESQPKFISSKPIIVVWVSGVYRAVAVQEAQQASCTASSLLTSLSLTHSAAYFDPFSHDVTFAFLLMNQMDLSQDPILISHHGHHANNLISHEFKCVKNNLLAVSNQQIWWFNYSILILATIT